MRVHQLESVDGFIVFDLDDAASASGPVRAGERIITGSAIELARSTSYAYALLEQPRSGASAAVNAPVDERAGALAAFRSEIRSLVADGVFLPDPAQGLNPGDLAELAPLDPRCAIDRDAALARCAMAAVTRSIEGLRLAIEGFGPSLLPLAQLAIDGGATVVAVAGDKKATFDAAGLSHTRLVEIARAGGGDSDEPAKKVFAADADVLFVGSRLGALGDTESRFVTARTVVPTAASTITAKAHARLRKAGTDIVADFAVLAGLIAAQWSDTADAAAIVRELTGDARRHQEGSYMGACYRAEQFLRTWQASLPFGRPFGS